MLLRIPLLLFLATVCHGSSFVYEDFLAHPRYRLKLTEKKIPESKLTSSMATSQQLSWLQDFPLDPPADHPDGSQVTMMSASGQPFLCTIPAITSRTKPTKSPEPDVEQTIERGLALLKPLDHQCLYFQTHGYWTYEYCHRQHVRQFHIDASKTDSNDRYMVDAKTSFILGHYEQPDYHEASTNLVAPIDKEGILYGTAVNPFLDPQQEKPPSAMTTSLKQVGGKRLLIQHWTDGTNCDLTNRPRSIDIQYQCDREAKDYIAMFEEVSTCHYLMTISTPRLCDDQLLSDTSDELAHTIECNPVVPEHLLLDGQRADHTQRAGEKPDPTDRQQTSEDVPEADEEIATEQQQRAASEPAPTEDDAVVEDEASLAAMVQQLTKQVRQLQRQLDHQQQIQQEDPMLMESIYFLDQSGQIMGQSSQAAAKAIVEQFLNSNQPKANSGQDRPPSSPNSPTTNHQQQNKKAYEKNYYIPH
ncbi:hypothetical protein DM01DRAFT_1406371 [Hesseltinella vesiculosa]|uniref:Protein OS-9 homolog n=1 Tax=Hesseltinella vesiculosa TaxID=101127 RepID=A0A1X2GMB9_9FUNG|nr:hypothetical protein DM01DRAFT_1406371 [Hesseltinella vesiculosa]